MKHFIGNELKETIEMRPQFSSHRMAGRTNFDFSRTLTLAWIEFNKKMFSNFFKRQTNLKRSGTLYFDSIDCSLTYFIS